MIRLGCHHKPSLSWKSNTRQKNSPQNEMFLISWNRPAILQTKISAISFWKLSRSLKKIKKLDIIKEKMVTIKPMGGFSFMLQALLWSLSVLQGFDIMVVAFTSLLVDLLNFFSIEQVLLIELIWATNLFYGSL